MSNQPIRELDLNDAQDSLIAASNNIEAAIEILINNRPDFLRGQTTGEITALLAHAAHVHGKVTEFSTLLNWLLAQRNS